MTYIQHTHTHTQCICIHISCMCICVYVCVCGAHSFLKRVVGNDPLTLAYAIYFWICTNLTLDRDVRLDESVKLGTYALQTKRCPVAGFSSLFETLITKCRIVNYIVSGFRLLSALSTHHAPRDATPNIP